MLEQRLDKTMLRAPANGTVRRDRRRRRQSPELRKVIANLPSRAERVVPGSTLTRSDASATSPVLALKGGAAHGRGGSVTWVRVLACPDGCGTAEVQLSSQSGLDRLVEAGLLFRKACRPHATYLFKHALVQDAAYGTL